MSNRFDRRFDGWPSAAGRGGLRLAVSLMLAICLGACAPPRFGNYGGPYRAPAVATSVPADGTRWHPIQARFAPDGRYLIVNLCRSGGRQNDDCRLAEYWPAEQRWRRLPVEAGHSQMWPSFSPDGKRLILVDLPCVEQRCDVLAGQMVTMPAHGGAATPLPIYGGRGPVYRPDGRRIAYWRYLGVNKLNSGRGSVAQAIYEYDLESGEEIPWLSHARTPLGDPLRAFDTAITGPFYHPDGDTLQFCGYRDGRWPVDGPIKCARLGRTGGNVVQIHGRAINPHAPKGTVSGMNTVFGTATPGTFIGQGYGKGRKGMFLALIDSASFEPFQELLGYGANTVADADYSMNARQAVAVTGILNGVGNRSSNNQYRIVGIGLDRYAYPALALIDGESLQYRTIEWPDIEEMAE